MWDNDAWRTNIETQDVEKVAWPAHCWHAHISRNGDYMISDSNGLKERYYRGCPSSVFFLNRRTGKHVQILSNPEMKGIVGARYHIDPHPRFCASDKLVVFTTTVRGEVDLAVIEADDLINRTT